MLRVPAGASTRQTCASATAGGVLRLALFDVGFRLNREIVQEWDESLYATSAWEMLNSGQWVARVMRALPLSSARVTTRSRLFPAA